LSQSPIQIRPLDQEDAKVYLFKQRQSRQLLKPWVQTPSTHQEFRAYIKEMSTPSHRAYAAIHTHTREMVGVVELRDIYMFDFKNSYITYYGFVGHLKQGFMRLAVHQVIQLAFHHLKLHRLEANIQPDNTASIALAHSCGFLKEGFSPKFIKKNGQWRDHERWAILNEKQNKRRAI